MALKFTKKAPTATADKVVEKTVTDAKGSIEKDEAGKAVKEVVEETHETEALDPVMVPSAHATVIMKAGKTINLGNFESARVDVGIEMPCDPDKVDETLDWCSGWVNGKLEEMTS